MGVRPRLVELHKPKEDADTVETLRGLLLLAETGQIQGIAYIALHNGNGYSGDVTGTARARPIYALGLAHMLEESLTQLLK